MSTTINFTSTSTDSDGTIVSSVWNFGDGSIGTGPIIPHVYPIANSVGSVATVAGIGGYSGYVDGYSGDGGLATAAKIRNPFDVAVDTAGNLYIADTGNHRIRKVAASTGIITTIAGTGVSGFSGDGGPATSAQLASPYGVCVDSVGNVYIGDSTNDRVRKITASTGIITTIAGGNSVGGDGGMGGLASACQLNVPRAVRLDTSGNVYIHEYNQNRLLKITISTGIITVLAGGGGTVPANGVAGTSANLSSWYNGLCLDAAGNLYIPMSNSGVSASRVFKLTVSTGLLSIVAGTGVSGFSGDGGPATSAKITQAYGVVVDPDGSMYISDSGNGTLRKVLPNGTIKTLAGVSSDGLYGQSPGFTFNYDDPNGGGQAVNTGLGNPNGCCLGPDGDLYLSVLGSDRILRMPQRRDYEVTLTVTDNDGAADDYTDTISVDIDDWPLHNASAASVIASAVDWWECDDGYNNGPTPPAFESEDYRVTVANTIPGAPLLYGGGGYGQLPGNYQIVAGTGYATPYTNYLYASQGFSSREAIPALNTSNWTIGGKFKLPEMGPNDSVTFVAHRSDAGVDSIAVVAHGNGTMSVRLNDGDVELTTSEVVWDGDTFFNVGVTYDGTSLRLYIDSSIVAQEAVDVAITAGADYFYLAAPSMWQVFICDASLDDAAMAYVNGRQYSRILADSAVP